MPSVQHCGVLAFDVYDRTSNTSAQAAGWLRWDAQNWTRGFAAGQYRRQSDRAEVVVAYRGTDTDDVFDALSDASMVPVVPRGAAQEVIASLARQYNLDDRHALTINAGRFLDALFRLAPVRNAIETHANRAPADQLRQALAYFDRIDPRPQFVTGHSLGGALAQLVSQQRSVPAIAFNSPSMGTIRGAQPMTSPIIAQINARGDPLSLATQSAGNLPHGRVITVPVVPFGRPPQLRQQQMRWLELLMPAVAFAREQAARLQYYQELLSYLGGVMLHHHSMKNLLITLSSEPRFAVPLRPDLGNL